MNRTEEREALYTAYSEKVRGYVFGKVANRHDAEDLVSDVFLKAYEKYPTFDADRASVSTWLYTITRNTVIDYFRTHRPGVSHAYVKILHRNALKTLRECFEAPIK